MGLTPWVLLRDRIVLSVFFAAVVLFGATGLALFGRDKPKAAKPSKYLYTHIHCPECQAEMPYTPALEKMTCPNCESGEALVPTKGSVREAEHSAIAYWGKVLALVLIAAVLVPSLGLVSIRRLRVLRRMAEDERNQRLIWYCPFCQGKIGYPLSKVGTGVVCSRCKTAFTLPPPVEE